MSEAAQMEEQNNSGMLPESAGGIPYDRQWLGSILRPALIAVMIACLDLALLSLMIRFNPALASGYAQVVVTLSILAALFACAATAWLAQPGRRQWRQPIFRLAEFCFVLIVARLLTWLALGTFPTPADLLYRPLASLFDGAFVFGAIVISLSWLLAGLVTDDFLRLALQPDEIFAIENDRIGELIRTSNSDRPAILQRIVARWVGGGILLVLIAASVRLERPETGFFAITRQNIDPTVIAAVIIYFLAGLLLISQGQLAILRTRWLIDRVPTSERVLGQWPIYVFGLLLVIGLMAMLLPFGGTFYLAQILHGIVTFFFNVIFTVFQFFMGLLLLIIAALSGDAPPEEAPPPPPPADPPAFGEMLPATNGMPEWAGGAFFWVIMALFLGYAAYVYLNDKGVRFTWLTAFWQLLRARWLALFGAYRQWQQTRLTLTPQEEEEAAQGRQRRRFRLGRGWQHLDPTQRVRYFYLAMLERAKESGIERATGETPLQYAPRLGQRMSRPPVTQPEQPNQPTLPAQADAATQDTTDYTQQVQELTTAFVRTRYAKGEIAEQEATALERIWDKVNTRLRMTK
ncbi:MAG: DUF4129 domain-containing protein [Caldilineaceae bacterium]|nr:DUF4129 domain-containing protein [Caldilineaceae bacterium]